MSSDYIKNLEEQNEELRQKLAMSEFEAEEYKKIIKDRKGLLVVVQDTNPSSITKLPFIADVVLRPTSKKMSGDWEYEVIKNRVGKTGGIYTLEEMRKKAQNYWQ